MSLNIRPLCPELAEKAKKELNEVPDRMAEDVNAIREWLKKQPHLTTRTDDQFLVNFLRGSKYSLERTKDKLDLYYTCRTAMPEMFADRDPQLPRNLEIIRMGMLLPLPLPMYPGGPRIVLFRPGVYDPSKYRMQDIFRINSLYMDVFMYEDDNMIVAGQVGFMDLKGASMAHFTAMSPTLIKKMMVLNQDAMPLRMKGVNYVHTPTGFETIFNLFKQFLNEKNRQRVHVHGDNMESLYEQIPKRLLPSEYGGEAGPIQDIIDEWENKIMSRRQFLLDESKYGSNESKRPGKPKNDEAIFGIDGSFRKLNVD